MKTRECMNCKKFFKCTGKVADGPCLHFEQREKYDAPKTKFEKLYDTLHNDQEKEQEDG